MTSGELTDDDPIAWTAIEQHTPVFTSNGEHVGTVEEVLGSAQTDIFHGIVVKPGRLQHSIAVLAQDVGLITPSHIDLSIDSAAFEALDPYVQEHTFALGIRGIFRHRPGWIEEKD